MNIRANRYNDPALGAAFENIASLFAPPSAQDTEAYASAAAKKAEAERLAWLFANPNDPLADRKATMAGVYAPTQSYYAVDQGNAVTRRGQDVTAASTLDKARIDGQFGLDKVRIDGQFGLDKARIDGQFGLDKARIDGQFGLANQFMTPLNPGQVQPGLPGSVAAQFGVPELPRAEGLPKPLSETEQLALERQQLRERGTLTDEMLIEGIRGAEAPVKVVGPNGPVYQTPGGAIGMPAHVDAGSAPKPENGMAVLRDGTSVPAIQNVTTGRWMHAQTGAELPPDIQVYKMPAPVGSNEQIGVGKPVANGIDRQLIDVAVAKDTAVKLRDLIASAPASQGAVGWLRGTTQNVIATGGELGQFFGGGVAEVAQAIESGAADASLAGAFDPNIPAIEMMANLLAFQYAKTTTGERLSNEMLRAARAALGLEGLTANQASSLARIDTAIKQMESQEEILRRIRSNGVGAGQAAPPAEPTAPPPAGGATKMRFDAEGNLIP